MIRIIQFLGTNCEYDTLKAYKNMGFDAELLWHDEKEIPKDTELLILPGGFSYGDYLRSGAIAQFSNIMKSTIKYANSGGKILGICNGFQILTEMGLLDGTLINNDNLNFISKMQYIKIINKDNDFLKLCEDKTMNIPIAHADGNFVCDKDTLKSLYDNNQVLLQYCDEFGDDESINGSVNHIAGICNKNKNVFGLMPHPERATNIILGSDDGINMLKGLMS